MRDISVENVFEAVKDLVIKKQLSETRGKNPTPNGSA